MKNPTFPDKEKSVIGRMIRQVIPVNSRPAILDVGCGYGRNLRYLVKLGAHVVGVDANPDAVAQNTSHGFECHLPDSDGWRQTYDCILMSHIIEHFSPPDLLDFMESYLSCLKPGGHLIIATPLLTSYFYDDYTHIKPYHPESILMIFGDANPQVSMRSATQLELCDLWFRRSAYKVRRARARYLGGWQGTCLKAINGMLAMTHTLSGGLVGEKDGWVGLFQKIRQCPTS